MAISKKLEIIYHNGQPDGIRSIRRHLSTMTTYVIPRPLLSEAKKLTGINRPGIYYLISETDDNKIAQIYVGQTRNGVSRLDDHNRSKDFWNKAIMFLADNKTFSLDMISGLEAFAIGKAIEAKRYKVENTVNPKYEIDEYDLPLIEEVYEEIKAKRVYDFLVSKGVNPKQLNYEGKGNSPDPFKKVQAANRAAIIQ